MRGGQSKSIATRTNTSYKNPMKKMGILFALCLFVLNTAYATNRVCEKSLWALAMGRWNDDSTRVRVPGLIFSRLVPAVDLGQPALPFLKDGSGGDIVSTIALDARQKRFYLLSTQTADIAATRPLAFEAQKISKDQYRDLASSYEKLPNQDDWRDMEEGDFRNLSNLLARKWRQRESPGKVVVEQILLSLKRDASDPFAESQEIDFKTPALNMGSTISIPSLAQTFAIGSSQLWIRQGQVNTRSDRGEAAFRFWVSSALNESEIDTPVTNRIVLSNRLFDTKRPLAPHEIESILRNGHAEISSGEHVWASDALSFHQISLTFSKDCGLKIIFEYVSRTGRILRFDPSLPNEEQTSITEYVPDYELVLEGAGRQ